MLTKMIRSAALAVALAGILCSTATAVPPPVQPLIGTPGTYGDQLIFFYDARTNRVPFLTISNMAGFDIPVEIVFYSQDLKQKLATETRTLVEYGNIVLDPTKISAVNGQAGLVFVTPVSGNPAKAVVPPSASVSPTPPLFGSYTLANTQLGAGFGQNPMGRSTVNRRGERPAAGKIVDGYEVRYQQIGPEALVVPTYFNPSSLSPASKDGNRIIVAAFWDRYASGGHDITPKLISFDVLFEDADGKDAAQKLDVPVGGVRFDTLQGLAGASTLQKSGKALFIARDPIEKGVNVIGVFSQALGTFSIGQRMPGIFMTDHDPEKLAFVAPVKDANLGGLDGADKICQQAANDADLPGRYRAWLSDSKDSPSTRFTRVGVRYVMPNGVPLTRDGDVSRGFRTTLRVAADGGSFPDQFVYTNTTSTGDPIQTDPSKICDDWTKNTGAGKVSAGDSSRTNPSWSNSEEVWCSPTNPIYGIYCFEQ